MKRFLIFLALFLAVAETAFGAIPATTTVNAAAAALYLTQSDYRWYANTDALDPVVPAAGENTSTAVPALGGAVRLRMNITDTSLAMSAGETFLLQYSNSTSGGWMDVGTSTPWVFFNNPSVPDGQAIITTMLSTSNVGENYAESNPTASAPNPINPGQKGEWDWSLKNQSADTTSDWYFRMIFSSSTPLNAYTRYPKLTGSPTPPPGGGTTGGGIFPYPEGQDLPPKILRTVDLNLDNRVDIIDLSILLYHYAKRGGAHARYDFNGDGAVDLGDISIMMYYWTG